MKLSQADLAEVEPVADAPKAGPIKLSQADLADVQDAEAPAAPSGPVDPRPKIGLNGPGSTDDSPSDVITKAVPHGPKDIPADLASGAAHTVKSIGRGLATLSGEASPLGPEGARVPFSGLMDDSKRREFGRGVSDVVTFGQAQRLGEWVDPSFAASAAPDATAAPGYRDAGGVAGMALPNPVGEVVSVAGKAGEAAIGRAGEAVKGVGEGSIGRSDKRLHEVLKEGGTPKQKGKLDEVGQADVDMVRKTPRLKAALGDAEKFHGAIEETLAPLEASQKETLARAQMVAGRAPTDVIEAELRAAQAKIGDAYSKEEIAKALQEHIDKAAIRSSKNNMIDLEDLRAEKSRLQKIAFDRSPTAKPTEAQEAAGIAAGVIKDALEAHIEKALPGEGKAFAQRATGESVLLRMKAIAARNVSTPRKPTGYFATMAKRFVTSPVGATLSAIPTGIKYGFRNADEALAALARAARRGARPADDMIQEALAAGVKPSSAAAIVDAVPEAVDDVATAAVRSEPMRDIVPRGSGGEDLAAGQAKRATAPDDFDLLDQTQRIVMP